jgi:hypothetical protein
MAVMPAFLLLVGRGIDRILERNRVAGAGVLAVWIAGAGLALAGIATAHPSDPELRLASYLKHETSEKDAAVLSGLLYPVVEYHCVRLDVPCRRIPFPPEVGDHPGWFDGGRAAREAGTTSRQALELAASLRATIDDGGRVIVLRSTRTPVLVNQRLEGALQERLGSPTVEGGPDIFILTYAGTLRSGGSAGQKSRRPTEDSEIAE